jgi:hypothetical protein
LETASTAPISDAAGLTATEFVCAAIELETGKGRGLSVRGYWPDPGAVRWKPAHISDLDTRVLFCDPSAQVWYAAAWIHAPVEMQITIAFHGHHQTSLRWLLNSEITQDEEIKKEDLQGRLISKKLLALRAGWNQLMFHGYCAGYPPFRTGAVLEAPAETLWKLKIIATPPTSNLEKK